LLVERCDENDADDERDRLAPSFEGLVDRLSDVDDESDGDSVLLSEGDAEILTATDDDNFDAVSELESDIESVGESVTVNETLPVEEIVMLSVGTLTLTDAVSLVEGLLSPSVAECDMDHEAVLLALNDVVRESEWTGEYDNVGDDESDSSGITVSDKDPDALRDGEIEWLFVTSNDPVTAE
jgi:hypothetical protein